MARLPSVTVFVGRAGIGFGFGVLSSFGITTPLLTRATLLASG